MAKRGGYAAGETARARAAQRQVGEQFSDRFGMRHLRNAKVKFEFVLLLLKTRCVGSTDIDPCSAGGIASETGTPEMGAEVVGEAASVN
jgi:hypothetical protein